MYIGLLHFNNFLRQYFYFSKQEKDHFNRRIKNILSIHFLILIFFKLMDLLFKNKLSTQWEV